MECLQAELNLVLTHHQPGGPHQTNLQSWKSSEIKSIRIMADVFKF